MNFNSKEPHESHFLPSCLETPVVDAPVGCKIEGHDVAAARVGAAWFSVSAKRLQMVLMISLSKVLFHCPVVNNGF